ncbi:selenocysteine lyase/cysteine desulfurase [Lewinella aquimaris]|uniref:Selenocysteine lyase/cysteine desulfurase n=1 Tax=Neolewinella aquimaris TaxID=1835722 RepID=A0A840E0D5_9BACT|nr:aminotransferase class V-fold PLP-dependent enzyme [Neolewinella aquimaris]MBB4077403.1 selenocysteine lyase/cysteine desulfurase [Neolewinella aquimaris]
MLDCQRHLFPLADYDAYLNGASRSPQLNAGAEAARQALQWREENSGMPIDAFFSPVERLRESFAGLIGAQEPERIALIPAASYGIATVARNLPLRAGQNIIVAQDQFPSNYYAWHRLCQEAGAHLITVARPTGDQDWSEAIIDAINADTAAVAMAQVHWSDGTLFDLASIRRRTDAFGSWLIVDGTQSIGAYPFDVECIRPDALIAAGYKWLLGPYGCGYAWYGPRMDGGVPLEENWINRAGSQHFSQLANYQNDYRPLAGRYSVGEHSNFLSIPMQQAAIDQLRAWQPEGVQAYTAALWAEITDDLANLKITLPRKRANHLVGLRLPRNIAVERVEEEFRARHISVSYRGDAIRVSPSVYNRPEEMDRMVDALRAATRT